MMNETNETKPPRMIWLQWYGDPDDQTGIGIGRPEGVTFHEEQVYANDLCYVRAGKPSPIMQQLLARAEAAEATRVETLENILQALGVDPIGIDEIYLEQTATGCIAALMSRIAELEAQLKQGRLDTLSIFDDMRARHQAELELAAGFANEKIQALNARIVELEAAQDAACPQCGQSLQGKGE